MEIPDLVVVCDGTVNIFKQGIQEELRPIIAISKLNIVVSVLTLNNGKTTAGEALSLDFNLLKSSLWNLAPGPNTKH